MVSLDLSSIPELPLIQPEGSVDPDSYDGLLSLPQIQQPPSCHFASGSPSLCLQSGEWYKAGAEDNLTGYYFSMLTQAVIKKIMGFDVQCLQYCDSALKHCDCVF